MPKLKTPAPVAAVDEDDPFTASFSSDQWTRGGHGIIISATTHLNRTTSRRSAVYGIGIQVDDCDKTKRRKGMNAVTRWIEGAPQRKELVELKLRQWAEVGPSLQSLCSMSDRRHSSTTAERKGTGRVLGVAAHPPRHLWLYLASH